MLFRSAHQGGYTTLYAHCSRVTASSGAAVKRGEKIAEVGHQIRAHLSHINHPIIGDGKYGINEINKKFKKSTQMLCSYKLKFNFSTESGILEYLNGKEFSL